jgi:hypothetical protein
MATNIMKMSNADAKALFEDKVRYGALSELDKLKVQKRMETMTESTSGLAASAAAVANKIKSTLIGGRKRKATRRRKGRKATRRHRK